MSDDVTYQEFLYGLQPKDPALKRQYEMLANIYEYAETEEESNAVFIINDDLSVMNLDAIRLAYPNMMIDAAEADKIRAGAFSLLGKARAIHNIKMD